MELESAIVSTMENADDPIIQGVREQIKSMFGHHLAQGKPMINSSTGDVIDGFQSPGSPSSPPHSISESLMPLLDLPDSVSVSTSALQQRKLSPHHLLSSPPPPAAAAQHHDTNVDDENREKKTTVYISPSSAPNTLEHPTSRVLEFASSTQGNQRLLHENLKGMLHEEIIENKKYHPSFWKEQNDIYGHPIPSEIERKEQEEDPIVPKPYPRGLKNWE